jgi:hypothetical protein
MGEIVGINIIKGAGALFLVFVICFIINVAMTIGDKPPMPNMGVAFAWVGTTPAMFYIGTGFWRRFVASLLGSIASIGGRAAFGVLTGALLSTGVLTESQALLFIFGPFAAIVNIGQLAIAYFVARAIVKWGARKPTSFAAA